MIEKEFYMHRCLELAVKAKGHTSPNPMVGAVIVARGRVIGEGYHHRCGEPHAEVNAVASVKEEDLPLLKESTIYVNLEPCSHYGKTPPCAKMLIERGIPYVVVGGLDPFPEVAGRGVKMLREAGVKVETGVCEEECEELNKRFLTFQRQLRPYIILKWAQSSDGFMAKEGERVHFSTPITHSLVYQMRSDEDAILIGTKTALVDNPSLTSHGLSKNPIRMVIDKSLKIPTSYHLFDGETRTILFTEQVKKNEGGVEYVTLDFTRSILPQIMEWCYKEKIQSLIVEGGAVLLQSFIDEQLGDEVRIEKSNIILKEGVAIPNAKVEVRERRMVDGNEIIWGKLIH